MASATDSAARTYWQSHPKRKIDCATCGASFLTKTPTVIYCCKECDRSEGQDRHRRRVPRVVEQRVRTCERCGVAFLEGTKRSSKQIAARQKQRFCSRKCAALGHPRVYKDKREQKRAYWSRRREREGRQKPGQICCIVCGDIFTQKRPSNIYCSARCRIKAKTIEKRETVACECKECGAIFQKEIGGKGRSVFCSDRCARKNGRRISRAVGKARLRGVRVEVVDPIKVFQRDGWRCHLCGRKTPKERRGTYHKRAPELDHIVPLAKGGEHSYANTACACRECNLKKSDSVLGQPSLLVV